MSNASVRAADAWYAVPGPENDVVLSTRIRLARNLADFPFPNRFRSDDAERVQSLVFEAFSHMHEAACFQTLPVSSLEPLGQHILCERGVISPDIVSCPLSGVVVRTDGRFSCTVNAADHLRLSSFSSGCSADSAFSLVRTIDLELQQMLQFAALTDFGFLTSSFRDMGSGMKVSFLVHMPSVAAAGQLERVFRELLAAGLVITGFYGSGAGGASLGSYYLISSGSSFAGSEETQIAAILSSVRQCIEFERNTRQQLADNKPTAIRDAVYRAVAVIKYGRLISFREGIELLSKIKWGRDLGILTGIDDTALFALLYRIQNAHLQYVLRTGNFTYEKDIATDDLRIERLRSLIIQDALAGVQLTA